MFLKRNMSEVKQRVPLVNLDNALCAPQLDVLPWNAVDDCVLCVYIGPRQSGKTTNMVSTLQKKLGCQTSGLVFSASKEAMKVFAIRTTSSTPIHFGFHPEILRDFLVQREQDVSMGDLEPVFVVLDDCISHKLDPSIADLLTSHNQLRILVLVSIQYGHLLPPNIRSQTDYAFLSFIKHQKQRRYLFENYSFSRKRMTFKVFVDNLVATTRQHGTLVIGGWNEPHVFRWTSPCMPKVEEEFPAAIWGQLCTVSLADLFVKTDAKKHQLSCSDSRKPGVAHVE